MKQETCELIVNIAFGFVFICLGIVLLVLAAAIIHDVF